MASRVEVGESTMMREPDTGTSRPVVLFLYDAGRYGHYTKVTTNPTYNAVRGDALCFCGRAATKTWIFITVNGYFLTGPAEHYCDDHSPADLHWTGTNPDPPRLLPVTGEPQHYTSNAVRYLRRDTYEHWYAMTSRKRA